MMRITKRMLLFIFCAFVCSEFLLLVLHYGFGYAIKFSGSAAYIVNLNEEVGVKSADGEFRLVELRDDSNQFIVYVVCDGQEIVYVPDFLFHTRFSGAPYWIGDTYDFCIPCSDTGAHVYIHELDKETMLDIWKPEIERVITYG